MAFTNYDFNKYADNNTAYSTRKKNWKRFL